MRGKRGFLIIKKVNMKKWFYLEVMVLSVLLNIVLSDCTKERINEFHKLRSEKNLYQELCNNVVEENGILCVQTFNHLLHLINNLDSLQEQYCETIASEFFSDLNDEQCVNFCDTTTLNFYYPFTEFENQFEYISLRSYLLNLEDAWLEETAGENIDEDPDNHYIEDDAFRCILNQYAELKIGHVYYRFLENGYFETTDINELVATRNGIYSSDMSNGHLVIDNEVRLECNSGKSSRGYKTNETGNRRIKWVVSHRTPFPVGRYAQAKTVNYYKKNGHWKRYATLCMSCVYGKVSGISGDCSDYYVFNTFQGSCNYKEASNKVKHRIDVHTMTKSGWIHGYHSGAGGITYTSTLVFPN